MKQEQTIQKLPDAICLASARKEADEALRQDVRDLQGAYKGLSGIAELSPVSTELKDITVGWLRERTDKRIDLVRNDMSLTEDERTTRLNAWVSIRARATRYINVITNVLSAWPDATWQFEEQIANIFCTNIDEVATAKATRQTSEEAKEHWEMVQKCLQYIRRLRAWEDEHDVISQNLAHFQCMTAEAFVQMWVDGIKFDRMTAERLGFHVGNFKDPKNPERIII